MIHRRRQFALLAILAAAVPLCSAPFVWGAEPNKAAIARLVNELDDDSFTVRETAYRKLLEIGLPALPDLQAAANSTSLEKRHRARQLAAGIQHQVLRAGFTELARQPDEELDLEQGMWLMARMIDPAVRRDDLSRQLDDLAERVHARLGKDVNPRKADPAKVVEAVRHVLFTDLGYIGNRDDYNNPKNSSLVHVLATRKGLPILLSQVVVAVGRRLHVPFVGIGLPGRYMVKYDGAQAPEGFAKSDIVIDAFGGGTIMTNEALKMSIPAFDPEEHLAPYGNRETLARMLRNLVSDFATAKQTAQAELAQELLTLVESYENNAP
jgi:regulator of sirC expression with transglutaminase-like and TPR domain